MSETIKANIIFGEPYNAERYQDVITACGLETDLKLFDDGDQTEIGEKGVTLSGGQKARITLARAVYCKAEVVLLDGEYKHEMFADRRHLLRSRYPHIAMDYRTSLQGTSHGWQDCVDHRELIHKHPFKRRASADHRLITSA